MNILNPAPIFIGEKMIRIFDYLKALPELEEEILEVITRVLHSGRLILGPETEAFEHEFAAYIGADSCIGVSSGTMALSLALFALDVGPGDEVITVANTCVPTASAIALTGAQPVFVDVCEYDLTIDPQLVKQSITARTKCILPVHLWGHPANLLELARISESAGLYLLEDCAQGIGARGPDDRHVGTYGKAGCFSFYPTKNLGAYGDAGAIVTSDGELALKLREKRMYGYTSPNFSTHPGMNARISEIQAAILRVKLRYLPEWQKRRTHIANRYVNEIENPSIVLPPVSIMPHHGCHQFVIRCQNRDRVIRQLEKNGIEWAIHYPTPLHRMPTYFSSYTNLPKTDCASEEILSIPVHEALTDQEVDFIITTLCNCH